VNDEMGALESVLLNAARLVRPGGRIVVLSYHSLEDKRVKVYSYLKYMLASERERERGFVASWEHSSSCCTLYHSLNIHDACTRISHIHV
jgi:16S rRNA C1402 N4-methylase RsmH